MQVLMIDASKCTECSSEKIKFNSRNAELFCQDCGFVLQEQLLVIEAQKGRLEKVYVNPREKKIAVILRSILKTPVEKKMTPFYAELKKLSLAKHIEAEIIVLCRSCVEQKLTMSYSKTKILASLVYLVSKKQGIPVIANELTKIFGISRTDLFRTSRFLQKKLKIEKNEVSIESYIIRAASELNCGSLVRRAVLISENINIASPNVAAAVAISLASENKIRKKELARSCGISEVSLRKNLKKFRSM